MRRFICWDIFCMALLLHSVTSINDTGTFLTNPCIHMSTSRHPNQPIGIKPYSKKELSYLYNISQKTLTRWMKPHLAAVGSREGRYYNMKQVHIIFDLFGVPGPLDTAA